MLNYPLTARSNLDDAKEDSEDMSEDEIDSQDDCKLVDVSSENDHHSCIARTLQSVVKDG